jgi:ATP diphosphatase
MSNRYSFEDLKYLMSRLRDPEDGCPWDIEQTYRTIVPHTLEEVYEVIDTIEQGDFEHLSEELGDLLFQVVFYAQIGADDGEFSLDDIVHKLVKKLIYRHPHVFPEGTLESRAEGDGLTDINVAAQWDALKQNEKSKAKKTGILADIPMALPGLLRAKKLQSRAAKVGFDWPDIEPVFDKVEEEFNELKEAVKLGSQREIEGELGDLLFVLANVARHLNIDPEQAIRSTNAKFEDRFGFVERSVTRSTRDWSSFSLEELDDFWNQAKQKESE